MKKLTVLTILLLSSKCFGFILISETYRLSIPEDTTINIASGACRPGVTDSEFIAAINTTIGYWNNVPESVLTLKLGGEVTRTLSDVALPGEILIGCRPLGVNGISIKNDANGSSVVSLNSTTLFPGNYLPGAVESTMVHEVGHAIGLSHSRDTASVMTYETTDWFLPAHLSEDDKNGVRYLYPNEGYLLGLLGGCSALAGTQDGHRRVALDWRSLFLELMMLLSLLIFIRLVKPKTKP